MRAFRRGDKVRHVDGPPSPERTIYVVFEDGYLAFEEEPGLAHRPHNYQLIGGTTQIRYYVDGSSSVFVHD